jgi:hypothetical protein
MNRQRFLKNEVVELQQKELTEKDREQIKQFFQQCFDKNKDSIMNAIVNANRDLFIYGNAFTRIEHNNEQV